MPRTPDRHPGEQDEEGTVYENLAPGNDPPALGGVRMVNGEFRMRDSIGVFNPRNATASVFAEVVFSIAGELVYVGDADIVTRS